MTNPAPQRKASDPASYFPSIEKKYGRPISEWLALIAHSCASQPRGGW
jgi:hypothetical protein